MPSSKIKKSLSSSRLSTYEAVVFNGTALSAEQALKLYAWNAQVSAAFFAPLHLCEVVIRNAVSEALGFIVLLPVICFVTRFRHEATAIEECNRSDRSFLI